MCIINYTDVYNELYKRVEPIIPTYITHDPAVLTERTDAMKSETDILSLNLQGYL